MRQRCESIGWHGYQCTQQTGHADAHHAMSYAFGLRVWFDEEESTDEDD